MAQPSPTSCPHLGMVRQPPKDKPLFKEECAQCFHTDASESGLNVCLTCFVGGCTGGESLEHSQRHCDVAAHPLALNIRKRPAPPDTEAEAEAAADRERERAQSNVDMSTEEGVSSARAAFEAAKSQLLKPAPEFLYESTVHCLACRVELPPNASPHLSRCVEAVLSSKSPIASALGAVVEDEVKTDCPHAANLKQVEQPPHLGERSLTTCASCDVKDSMWLCLTCGALGCPRKQMLPDGSWSKANGHAVSHSAETGHPLVVKIGTITAEGKGDCHCYSCNATVENPNLVQHMRSFGVLIDDSTVATEASTADLSADFNLRRDWSAVFDEEGREEPLAFGPGRTGLANLGNSCYLASVLQVLLAMPHFRQRYFEPAAEHLASCCAERPSECFRCQMSKLSVGMLSGHYDREPTEHHLEAVKREREERMQRYKAVKEGKQVPLDSMELHNINKTKPLQSGVPPLMFKTLIAGRHPEFSSGRQQDSFEYLHHLLDYLRKKEHEAGAPPVQQQGGGKFDPYAPFAFWQEERLQCARCNQVRYKNVKHTEMALPIPLPEPLPPKEEPATAATADAAAEKKEEGAKKEGDKKDAPKMPAPKEYPPVSFDACLTEWSRPSRSAGWSCPSCRSAGDVLQSQRFHTYPRYLLVHVRRFVCEGWVPEKLDIQVQLEGEGTVDLDALRAKGMQKEEVALPQEEASPAPGASAGPQADASIVSSLQSMGFSAYACTRAALAVNNAGVEAASEWLFAHMEDPDLNDPLPEPSASSSGGGAGEPSGEAVENLMAMGFDAARARFALKQCDNDPNRAVEWLFSHADEDLPMEDAASSEPQQDNKPPEAPDAAPAGYELFAFITHMGKSTASGHYIAHVKKEGKWLQFNDHKVSYSANPMKAAAQAYLLFFQRIQA